jgi:regulator of RNase E activity RraA
VSIPHQHSIAHQQEEDNMATDDVGPEIVAGLGRIGVPTLVDVLDHQLGLRAWLRPGFAPIFKARIAGRAVTLLEEARAGAPPAAIAGFFDAADACGPGTVLVASLTGDDSLSIMGDLVALALHMRGCAGAVLDGAVRDTERMIEIGFPVFATRHSPVDKTGKAVTVSYNRPIECGGVTVRPGDIVVADWDGVVVVPPARAAEVLARARRVIEAEADLVAAIQAEARTARLADIFARFE